MEQSVWRPSSPSRVTLYQDHLLGTWRVTPQKHVGGSVWLCAWTLYPWLLLRSPCKVGISRAAPRCQQLLPSSLSWLLLEDSVLLCVLAQDFTQVAACCLTNGGSPGSCFIGWWWNGAGSSGGKTGSVSYPQPAPCLPSEAAHVVLPRLCYHLPTSLAQLSTPRAGRQPAAPGIRWAVTDWHAIKTAAIPFSNSTFPSFSCSFLLPERLDFHLLL